MARRVEAEERWREVNEGKYTLSYYTVDDLDSDKPPFKYRTFYLEDALAEAWRIHNTGGRAEGISYNDKQLITIDELLSVGIRISELSNSAPGRDPQELAKQVILERDYLPLST
jgi:hypothetical protein